MPFAQKPPAYDIWLAMNDRCRNVRHRYFNRYGGRGIAVCDEWQHSYAAFIRDMGPPPKGYTLERRDNDGPYSPDNCVWATRKQQSNNTSTNRLITFAGQTRTLSQWSEHMGISPSVMRSRLLKWPIERALTEPHKPRNQPVAFNGESHTIAEWSRIVGLSEETVRARLTAGWSLERALMPVAHQRSSQ